VVDPGCRKKWSRDHFFRSDPESWKKWPENAKFSVRTEISIESWSQDHFSTISIIKKSKEFTLFRMSRDQKKWRNRRFPISFSRNFEKSRPKTHFFVYRGSTVETEFRTEISSRKANFWPKVEKTTPESEKKRSESGPKVKKTAPNRFFFDFPARILLFFSLSDRILARKGVGSPRPHFFHDWKRIPCKIRPENAEISIGKQGATTLWVWQRGLIRNFTN